MGGKHKQAQRTKNNTRPSNSGRSAELLGNSMPQFACFAGAKETGFVLPGFSLAEDIDSSLDSNFQLVLKKMYKKDSTTKLKALQEFADLIKSSDPEAVKTVLSFWPRLYNALATDTEHRIREATHNAHYQVVLKVKRNLAPYLKQLMGPWFTSQYDTYAPAASAASESFKSAFPPNKIQEVIIFCQEEILQYILQNLTVQTPQTINASKILTAEEAEARYERILISSLQGYSLYLNKTPSEQIEKAIDLNNKIVSSNRFWKLSKHKSVPVRAAWYGVLTVVCQKVPFLFRNEGAHVTSAVFSNLDETEPTVLPSVWDAALLAMTSIKEWWTHVSIEKLLLPKLWKLLREGGQGNAAVICPNLLPFVSRLPPLADMDSFYNNFFENFKSGLKQKSVLSSKSESTAIASALIECIQYIILKNQTNRELCERILKTHLMSLIEWCLTDNFANHKTVFNQVATLIQTWSRNVSLPEYSNYSHYLQFFWDNVTSLCQDVLHKLEHTHDAEVIREMGNKQLDLLQSFRHTCKPKRRLKVQFSTDSTGEVHSSEKEVDAASCTHSYLESLTRLVYKISSVYVKLVDEKKCKVILEHLHSLVQDFDSEAFYRHIRREFTRGKPEDFTEVSGNLLFGWLKSHYLCCKPVVDLIFLLLKYLRPEEEEQMLRSLNQVCSADCLGWCIAEALSHPHNKNPLIRSWLREKNVTDFLVDIIEKEMTDCCPADLSALFRIAFTANEDGELLISKEAVTSIIEKLQLPLLSPDDFSLTLDTCASLAAYISAMVYTDTLLLTYGEHLLLALFHLSCDNVEGDYLSRDTLWEVSTAWQDALSTLSEHQPKSDFQQLMSTLGRIVEEKFIACSDVLNVDHMADAIVNIFRAVYKNAPLQMEELLAQFFDREFLDVWELYIADACVSSAYITGKLSSPYAGVNLRQESFPESNILKYFIWSHMKISALSKPITKDEGFNEYAAKEEFGEASAEDNDTEFEPLIVDCIDNSEVIVVKLLYTLGAASMFLEGYQTTKYASDIASCRQRIKDEIINLLRHESKLKQKVQDQLKIRMKKEAWIWVRAAFLFYSEISAEDLPDTFDALFKICERERNMLGILHLTQTFAKSISYDNVQCRFSAVESIVVLRSVSHCDEIDVQIAEAFGKIEKLRNESAPLFLHDWSDDSYVDAQEIIEVVRLCDALIKNKSRDISKRYWDFIVVFLASWSTNMLKVKAQYRNAEVQALIVSIANLFVSIEDYVAQLEISDPKSNCVCEWNDVFVQGVHNDVVQMWFSLAEQFEQLEANIPVTYHPFLREFGAVIDKFNHSYIFNSDCIPKWSKFLKRCFTLLSNPLTTLQLWGYKMLLALIPGLVEIDALAVQNNTPHEKGLIFEQFKSVLVKTQDIVNSMLLGFKLGEDSCRVEQFTDSYTYTFAYLLLWDVLLTLCEKSSTELRYQYADWLKEEDFLKNLLNNLFRLMPTEILRNTEGKSKVLADLFLRRPCLDMKDSATSEKIEHMVCWVYCLSLSQLPALVRQWWSGTETRIAQIVEKVTTTYVSPQLCIQELTDVGQHETTFKNMVIKVIPSVREVIAIYTVDEAQMELVITLPQNYPLGGPDVQCNRQIGGTSHKQWLMQLKKCVLHQNGRIWDGLSLWNNNLDKKFDGVEECYICFAVLHPGTYQLPRLSCQTCKKKFHSSCLYKWFSTSNKSSCPICRNLF